MPPLEPRQWDQTKASVIKFTDSRIQLEASIQQTKVCIVQQPEQTNPVRRLGILDRLLRLERGLHPCRRRFCQLPQNR